MAVPTVTIQGKVILPSGDAATSGKIISELNEAGKVNDGSNDHRAGGKIETIIESDGSVDFTLIPNDQITLDGQGSPGGGWHKVTIQIDTPYRHEMNEEWELASTPNPIDIGAIPRRTS